MNDNIIQLDKNSYVLTSNNDKVSAFGNAKPGNIGTGFNPVGVYNNNYIGYDLNGVRNANQSNWNRFGYVAANFVSNFLIGIGEGVGSLGYPIFGFNSDYGRAMDKLTSMRNPITSDDFMLNYKDPSKAYDLSDPSTYFSMGAGLVESMASFAVTGNIFAGGIEALEPFVAKAVTNTVKAAKYASTFGKTAELGANTSRNILNAMKYAKQGTQALAMSHSEGVLIGNDVYNQGLMHYSKPIIDKIYNQKLQDYINQTTAMNPDIPFDGTQIPSAIKQMLMNEATVEGKKEANNIYGKELGKAAFITSVTNTLLGLTTDWISAGMFINKNGNIKRAVLKNNTGERTLLTNALHGARTAEEGAAKLATMTPILNKVRAFGMYMGQGGREFFEEAWLNNTAEWMGTKYLGINEKDYKDFIFSTKSLIDGTLGFIGGFGQTALVNASSKYIDGKRIGENGEDLGRMSRNSYNKYLENANITKQFDNLKTDLQGLGDRILTVNELQQALAKAKEKGDALSIRTLIPQLDEAEDALFHLSKLKAVRDGNGDLLKKFYENVANYDNTKFEEITNADGTTSTSNQSEAMRMGFATELNDDNYRKRAMEAVASIDEAQRIWGEAQINYNVDGHDHTNYADSILSLHILTNDMKNTVNKNTEHYNKLETEFNNVIQNANLGGMNSYFDVVKKETFLKAALEDNKLVLEQHKKELKEFEDELANTNKLDDKYKQLEATAEPFRALNSRKIAKITDNIKELETSLDSTSKSKLEAFNDYLLTLPKYNEQQNIINNANTNIEIANATIDTESKNKGKFIKNDNGETVIDEEANAFADKLIKKAKDDIKKAKDEIKKAEVEQGKISKVETDKVIAEKNKISMILDNMTISHTHLTRNKSNLSFLQNETSRLTTQEGIKEYKKHWQSERHRISTMYEMTYNREVQKANPTNVETDTKTETETDTKEDVVTDTTNRDLVNKVLTVIDNHAKTNNISTLEAITQIRIELLTDINNENIVPRIAALEQLLKNKTDFTKFTSEEINGLNTVFNLYNNMDRHMQRLFGVSLNEILTILDTSVDNNYADLATLLHTNLFIYSEYGNRTLEEIVRPIINIVLSYLGDPIAHPVINDNVGKIISKGFDEFNEQRNKYVLTLNKYINAVNESLKKKSETKTETEDTNEAPTIIDEVIDTIWTQFGYRTSIEDMLNNEITKYIDGVITSTVEKDINNIDLKINNVSDISRLTNELSKLIHTHGDNSNVKNYFLAKLLLVNGKQFFKQNVVTTDNDTITDSIKIFDTITMHTQDGTINKERKKDIDAILDIKVGDEVIPILTKSNTEYTTIIKDKGYNVANDDILLTDNKGNVVGSLQTHQYHESMLSLGNNLVDIAKNNTEQLQLVKVALQNLNIQLKSKNKQEQAAASEALLSIAKHFNEIGELKIGDVSIKISEQTLTDIHKYYTKDKAENADIILTHITALLNRYKDNELSLEQSLQRWVNIIQNDMKITDTIRKSVIDGKPIKLKVDSKSTGSVENNGKHSIISKIVTPPSFEEAKKNTFIVMNDNGVFKNAMTGENYTNSILTKLAPGQLAVMSNQSMNNTVVPLQIFYETLSETSQKHVITLFKQLTNEYNTNGKDRNGDVYNQIVAKLEGFIQHSYKNQKVFTVSDDGKHLIIKHATTTKDLLFDLNHENDITKLKVQLSKIQRNINFELLKNNADYYNSVMNSDDITLHVNPLMMDDKIISMTQPRGSVPFSLKIKEDINGVNESTTKTDNDILSKGDDDNTKVESDAKSDAKVDNPIVEDTTKVTQIDSKSPIEKDNIIVDTNILPNFNDTTDNDEEINPYIIYDSNYSDNGIKLLNTIVRDNSTMTSDKVIFNYIDSHFADNTTSELHKILDLLYKFKYNVKVVDSIAIYNPTAQEGTYMYWNGTEIVLGKEEIVNNNSNDFIYRFLHEVIHGVTNEQMKDVNSLLFKTTQQELAKAIKLIGTYDTNGKLITTNDYYGLTNEKEFLSEIFTNAKFRELLINAETTSSSLNIVQRIINNIIKFITGNTIWNDDNLKLETINDLKSYNLLTKLIDYKINNNDIYSKNIKNNNIDTINVPLFDYNNNNEIKYSLDAVNVLQSDKGKQIFDKGIKNNWSIDKILNELSLPKAEKQLILNTGITNREDLIVELATKYSYSVQINTAKEKPIKQSSLDSPESFIDDFGNEYTRDYSDTHEGFDYFKNGNLITKQQFDKEYQDSLDDVVENQNTQHYSNLSAPGGIGRNKYEGNPDWEYQELEFKTPLITPSIKGHAQFATDNGIGWARVWYNKKTGVVEIQEIQSDLFQKGRDKKDLIGKIDAENDIFEFMASEWDDDYVEKDDRGALKTKENQFLQLLNKDNNWVTFFIKSIIQDSAKKGYEKVLFPKGETAAKIEGHETIAERIKAINSKISDIQTNPYNIDSVHDNIGYSIEKNTEIIKKIDDKYYHIPSYVFPSKNMKEISREEFIVLWKEGDERKLIALNNEKANLKSQGVEKLKPIEAFYEIKVGNILEKQFGKENVKTITDEYGNEWREVTILKDTNLSEITTQQEIEEQRKHCNK